MGLIKQIDDQMGVLMQFLEARGLLDTTMIVFTSDHGDYLGDHWMGEKDLFHEQSAKIPLIVIDPSAAADSTRGTVSDALVEAIDLAPTFIDYFGSHPPDHILEGRSLLPLLHGERPADWRKVVFSEYDYAMQDVRVMLNQPIERCRLFMVFDGRWKFITPPASGRCSTTSKPTRRNFRSRRRPACADIVARLQSELFDWALHPRMHITTPNAKIAAYAAQQLQVKERRADRHLGRGRTRRDQGKDRDETLSARPRTCRSCSAPALSQSHRGASVLRRRHVLLVNCRRSRHIYCSSERAGVTFPPAKHLAALWGAQ
jgi:hypothetical protein